MFEQGSASADADTSEVCQAGPRRLWDEIETADQRWIDMGKPGLHAWRFTVTPSGQRVEPQTATSTLSGVAG